MIISGVSTTSKRLCGFLP